LELSSNQKDALTELINIGYGRAAGAMSELTGYRIALEVPQVSMHEARALGPMLETMLGTEIVSVNQRFSGSLSGTALLLLDEPSALALSRLLSDERSVARDFDSNAKEIITEVGNILLNACLGVFGNLLQINVAFNVPILEVGDVPRVLDSVVNRSEEKLRYGLMIHTRFHAKTGEVTGYLVIVLGIDSLDRLLQEVENWENRQLR
jgi:chemotaxis protein CheC